MRRFKTAAENRTNYFYYGVDGEPIQITPSDVESHWIALLHDLDDEEVDAERRENYHAPVHYQEYAEETADSMCDHNAYLSDASADPLEQILHMIDVEEHQLKLERLMTAISELSPEQKELLVQKFYLRKSNVDIAKDECVSETAIRKRLNRIFARLAKKI